MPVIFAPKGLNIVAQCKSNDGLRAISEDLDRGGSCSSDTQ
jgi:hypothetical protein